ncbi:MAG: TetR/AcrR family transcriptional repressor of nem operon [Cocleimonas sp.]
MSNILKNTGITKGALYHHFENKVVLGHAVLDEVIQETIYSTWIEPFNNTEDPITTLQDIIINFGSVMKEDDISLGCPLNNLAQEMSPIDEDFRDRIADIYQEWQDVIATSLERAKEKGNVKHSVDSEEVALMFVASLQGCIGFAKSVQKLDTLMTCGKGLADRLESLRQ